MYLAPSPAIHAHPRAQLSSLKPGLPCPATEWLHGLVSKERALTVPLPRGGRIVWSLGRTTGTDSSVVSSMYVTGLLSCSRAVLPCAVWCVLQQHTTHNVADTHVIIIIIMPHVQPHASVKGILMIMIMVIALCAVHLDAGNLCAVGVSCVQRTTHDAALCVCLAWVQRTTNPRQATVPGQLTARAL